MVEDGSAHTGWAVPGTKVCSAHTNRYHADGSYRLGVAADIKPHGEHRE